MLELDYSDLLKISTTLDKDDVTLTNTVDHVSTNNQQNSLENKFGRPTFTFNIMAAMCNGNRGIGMQLKLPWPLLR